LGRPSQGSRADEQGLFAKNTLLIELTISPEFMPLPLAEAKIGEEHMSM